MQKIKGEKRMINLLGLKEKLEKIAAWFQPTYNKIKAWDLPPIVEQMLDAIWKTLDPVVQKKIWEFIKHIYDNYGPEKAKEILAKILEFFSGIIKVDDNKQYIVLYQKKNKGDTSNRMPLI